MITPRQFFLGLATYFAIFGLFTFFVPHAVARADGFPSEESMKSDDMVLVLRGYGCALHSQVNLVVIL